MNDESKSDLTPPPGESSPSPSPKKRSSWVPVLVLLGAFLVGLVPMWLKANRLNAELLRVQRQLRVDEIQLTLANAALDARRGEYEPARQGMTRFFSLLTAETERGIGSALPAGASTEMQPWLAQRDDLITLLARSDPASAERLANAYQSFRKAAGP